MLGIGLVAGLCGAIGAIAGAIVANRPRNDARIIRLTMLEKIWRNDMKELRSLIDSADKRCHARQMAMVAELSPKSVEKSVRKP